MTDPSDLAGGRYDRIGRSYGQTRREDPRIAAVIWAALGPAVTVVNVGAGTGNYEPRDRAVVAVEPSERMIAQRPEHAPPVLRAVAEALPLADRTFDAAMAILTMHHWHDPVAGICELQRVASRQVVLYFEPLRDSGFWGFEYFPEAAGLETELDPPGETLLRALLEVRSILPVLLPNDCTDGFGAAYWARPEALLDHGVRAGMSWLAMLSDEVQSAGVERLRSDLRSGAWDRRYGHLRHQAEFDGRFRLAVAGAS